MRTKRLFYGLTPGTSTFSGQRASQAQHLGTIGLQREVAKRAGIGVGTRMDLPAESGGQFAGENRVKLYETGPIKWHLL